MPITEDALRQIRDRESLYAFLRDHLRWPVDPQDTFTYAGPQLHGPTATRAEVEQIIPFGANDPFAILLVEFETEFRRGDLREILRAVRDADRDMGKYGGRRLDEMVFICAEKEHAEKGYAGLRFAHFDERPGRQPRLRSFGWERDQPYGTRTLRELNLPELTMPALNDLGEPDWAEGRPRWMSAWDVEKVTSEFYRDYEDVFTEVETRYVHGVSGDRRLFTQRLFNRLLFIHFLSKKGWLRFAGSADYLQAIWDGRDRTSNFYNAHLSPLFFAGLNNPQARNLMRDNPVLHSRIGDVPFLNGGLFERAKDEGKAERIDDEAFPLIVDGLFGRYNFTVTESTPDDIEVAVDPEMLGKVFEELVTGRHESGSYYTPRPVVAFMCREALKGYLAPTGVPGELSADAVAALVDEHASGSITLPQARALLRRLAAIKVVDPACGSGAYLLGMLHALNSLTLLLSTHVDHEDARNGYKRKLGIIQNNLFGVDLDLFAVNTARLRLWLSLAVEYEGGDPPPLPNLDFKIEQGDSLTAPDPHGGPQPDMFREMSILDFEEMKAQYADPEWKGNKQDLLTRIADLRKSIADWAHPRGATPGFDWRVEFAGAFAAGGFDVVLANPPYGEGAVTDALRDTLFGARSGQSKDIYAAFMARAFHLVRPGGMVSYITSNTWRTICTHRPLRRLILDRATVLHVLDVPEWIFKTPVVRTCIVTFRNAAASSGHRLIAADLMALPAGDWATLEANLLAVAAKGPDLQNLAFARYTYEQGLVRLDPNAALFIAMPSLQRFFTDTRFSRLGEGVQPIATVAQGLATADNDYYLRCRGGGRYRAVDPNLVLADHERRAFASRPIEERLRGIDPSEFGGRHFIPYDKGGKSDIQAGGWLPCYYVPTDYYIDWSRSAVKRLRAASIADCKRRRGERDKIKPGDSEKRAAVMRNPELYFEPGVTFSRTGRYAPTFRTNARSVFDSEGSGIFPNSYDSDALLAVLNSRLVRVFVKAFVNSAWHAEVNEIKRLPIPRDSGAEVRLADLARRIIAQQQLDPRYAYWLYEQREIEAETNALYGLTPEEVRDIDLWYCRYERGRLAEARGLTAEVRNAYADHLAWCDSVLSRPPSYWRSHPILSLIAQGEGQKLDFKEAMAVNLKTGAKSDDAFTSTAKTIAAFLNTDGGTLLIGVSDAGEIKGLTADYQHCKNRNTDGFEQRLRSYIRSHLSAPLGAMTIAFGHFAEGDVCQVDVAPHPGITYLDNKDVYVRDGNGCRQLEGPEFLAWAAQRKAP